MGTTTVRLSDEEAALLDEVAAEFGGRSNALKAGLRGLVAEVRRRRSLEAFLDEWERELGPVDPSEIARMVDRYGL